MYSAGQIVPIRVPSRPQGGASFGTLPMQVEPSIRFVRAWSQTGNGNVAELVPGISNRTPIRQITEVNAGARDIQRAENLPSLGNLSPSLRPGVNSNTVGDVEELWKQSVRYDPAISSSNSKTNALGVEIAAPAWLPAELHEEYIRAWEMVVEDKLTYFEENPLTWLGIEDPIKRYKKFPNNKELQKWFEVEAKILLPSFMRKAQEFQARECFVTPEDQVFLDDLTVLSGRRPSQKLWSPKWDEVIYQWKSGKKLPNQVSETYIADMPIEELQKRIAESEKLRMQFEAQRRPDESVLDWVQRLNRIAFERAMQKSTLPTGALGVRMGGGEKASSDGVKPSAARDEREEPDMDAPEAVQVRSFLDTGNLADLKTVLFIVAMDVEFQAAQSSIDGWERVAPPFGVDDLLEYKRGYRAFYLMKSGVGQVSAALAADSVIQSHSPDAVILLGVGGSLSSELSIGDVVIGTAVVQHDSVYIGPNGVELMRPGALHLSSTNRPAPQFSPFEPLKVLIEGALNMAGQAIRYSAGTIMTGNQFVGTTEAKNNIARLADDSLLVEMESAGIALACERRNVPFVVAKTVSDGLTADGGIDVDYKLFLQSSAQNAATIVSQVMKFLEGQEP